MVGSSSPGEMRQTSQGHPFRKCHGESRASSVPVFFCPSHLHSAESPGQAGVVPMAFVMAPSCKYLHRGLKMFKVQAQVLLAMSSSPHPQLHMRGSTSGQSVACCGAPECYSLLNWLRYYIMMLFMHIIL